jgi:hypothetical protein
MYYLAADAVFSLVGSAIEKYKVFRQSFNAAKTTGKVDGIAKQIDDLVKSGMQVKVNNLVAELSLIGIRVFMFAENGAGLHY